MLAPVLVVADGQTGGREPPRRWAAASPTGTWAHWQSSSAPRGRQRSRGSLSRKEEVGPQLERGLWDYISRLVKNKLARIFANVAS